MLAYDKKQIGRIHRILIPAVIFTAAVLLGRMDTIMADFGQSAQPFCLPNPTNILGLEK